MYENLKGKKLLVIGSDAGNINIINAAREMGVYTIAVDGITDRSKAPAKNSADEAWDIDYSDTKSIAEKCRQTGVNGVLAGYSEYRVLAACKIADELGLPFYATEEQINITRNKRTFKDLCQKYNIPTPKDYCFSYPMSDKEKEKIEYPVIIKPADYAGRKGISVCFDKSQLDSAIEYAASKSQSKTVIVEDYLDGIEFSSIYTVKNGEISLSAVNEKYITDDQEIKTGLCEFLISPAYSYNRYISELDEKIRAFIKGINAKNGVVFFQGMVTEKKIFVFEMGYRVNGNNDYLIIDKFNNINYMKMLVAHSLTGDMTDDLSKDNPIYPQFACTLLFYAHKGTIGKIEYENIKSDKRIEDIDVRGWVGKEILEDGSTGQCVLKMKITSDNTKELVELVKSIQSEVKVEDENGENMLFKPFDADLLINK